MAIKGECKKCTFQAKRGISSRIMISSAQWQWWPVISFFYFLVKFIDIFKIKQVLCLFLDLQTSRCIYASFSKTHIHVPLFILMLEICKKVECWNIYHQKSSRNVLEVMKLKQRYSTPGCTWYNAFDVIIFVQIIMIKKQIVQWFYLHF